MKTIYLSVPMTGRPNLNFEAFHAEAQRLRALGYQVINPAEINPDNSLAWHDCMRADIRALMACDTIATLPGWLESQGAHLEVHIGHRVGMRIVEAEQIVCPADGELRTNDGRSDSEIVQQTEVLAAVLALWKWGLELEDGSQPFRDTLNRKGAECWRLACEIQEMLTQTDVYNAVAIVDDGGAA